MDHTPAPKFILIGDCAVNRDEVNVVRPNGHDSVKIEFKKGSHVIAVGTTAEGALSLLNGAAF